MARWSRRHFWRYFTETHVKWESKGTWRYKGRTVEEKKRASSERGKFWNVWGRVAGVHEGGKEQCKVSMKGSWGPHRHGKRFRFYVKYNRRSFKSFELDHFGYRTILKVSRSGSLRVPNSPGERWLIVSGTAAPALEVIRSSHLWFIFWKSTTDGSFHCREVRRKEIKNESYVWNLRNSEM